MHEAVIAAPPHSCINCLHALPLHHINLAFLRAYCLPFALRANNNYRIW